MRRLLFSSLLALPSIAWGYPWPASSTKPDIITNPTEQQFVSASFGEVRLKTVRGTLILRHHFHNGVDIKARKGSKVYVVAKGEVKSPFVIGRRGKKRDLGIRIGNFVYMHIKVDPDIREISKHSKREDRIVKKGTYIGVTNWRNHVHLTEGPQRKYINPLRLQDRGEPAGGLSPFTDRSSPTVGNVVITPDFPDPAWTEPEPFEKDEEGRFVVKEKVDVIATAIDKITNGTPSAGIYSIGYEVFAVGNPTTPVKSAKDNIVFDGLPRNRDVKGVYAKGSFISPTFGQSIFRYIASNQVEGSQVVNDSWDTTEVPNGEYLVKVSAKDADFNEGSAVVKVLVDNEEAPPGPAGIWPMFQHDARRTGQSQLLGPSTKPELLWSFSLGLGYSLEYRQPTVGLDGTIFISWSGRYDTVVTSIKPDGTFLWSFSAPQRWGRASIALGSDKVFFSVENTLYALNQTDGTEAWPQPVTLPDTIEPTSLTIGPDETIYLLLRSWDLFAITSTGEIKFSVPGAGGVPSIGPDGTIYVHKRNVLCAFNPDGSDKFTKPLPFTTHAYLYIGQDGTLFAPFVTAVINFSQSDTCPSEPVTVMDISQLWQIQWDLYQSGCPWRDMGVSKFSNFAAISPAGDVMWTAEVGPVVRYYHPHFAITSDAKLIVPPFDSRNKREVKAFNTTDGSLAWTFNVLDIFPFNGSAPWFPITDSGGNTYFITDRWGGLVALDGNGDYLWHIKGDYLLMYTAISIGQDGTLLGPFGYYLPEALVAYSNVITLLASSKGFTTQSLTTPSKLGTQGADPTFKLGEVYTFPNPAKRQNPTFHVEVGVADKVDIHIYDLSRDRVHETSLSGTPLVIDDGQGPQYAYEYTWDVSGVGSGVYVYVMTARKGSETIKKIGKCAVIK